MTATTKRQPIDGYLHFQRSGRLRSVRVRNRNELTRALMLAAADLKEGARAEVVRLAGVADLRDCVWGAGSERIDFYPATPRNIAARPANRGWSNTGAVPTPARTAKMGTPRPLGETPEGL